MSKRKRDNGNCEKCGKPLGRPKNKRKSDICNQCRDRTGENNPFYGKKHSQESIDNAREKNREASRRLWEDPEYRRKVIENSSKPRSEEGKRNISEGVKRSYVSIEGLREQRRDTMIQRIDEGYDPGHGRFLAGEGWGNCSVVEGLNCESDLEANRVRSLVEKGFTVKKFTTSDKVSKAIKYYDSEKNRERRYFPDYVINDVFVEELKYTNALNQKRVHEKYKAAYVYYKVLGKKYYIVTQKDIDDLPEIVYNSNINKTLRKELGCEEEN